MKEIEALLMEDTPSPSDVTTLMVDLRNLLEERNLKSHYPVINMYSNWIAHTRIDESNEGYQILERLTDILLANSAKPLDQAFFGTFARGLTDQLRVELRALFVRTKLPTRKINDDADWRNLLQMIVERLLDRPLCFPSPGVRKVADKAWSAIKAKVGSLNLAIHSIKYVMGPFPERPSYGGLFLELQVAMNDGSGFTTWMIECVI